MLFYWYDKMVYAKGVGKGDSGKICGWFSRNFFKMISYLVFRDAYFQCVQSFSSLCTSLVFTLILYSLFSSQIWLTSHLSTVLHFILTVVLFFRVFHFLSFLHFFQCYINYISVFPVSCKEINFRLYMY